MDTRIFLENFSVIADAHNGVPQIRDLILEKALAGLLIEHTVPATKWPIVTLSDLGEMVRGVTYPKAISSKEPETGYVPLLGAANIQGSLNFDNLTYVPSNLVKQKQLLIQNDILICMSSGSKSLVGKAAVVETDLVSSFGAFCGVFRLEDDTSIDFFRMFFRSRTYREAISGSSRGMGINNLRVGDVTTISLMLPPLEEQEHIVTKVDELMAMCDELEAEKAKQERLRSAARNSAIDSISTATTPKELSTAWSRISNNWETIADSAKSIQSLRELIFSMAVNGSLIGKLFTEQHQLGEHVDVLNGDRSKNYPSKENRVSEGIPFINAGHLVNGKIANENMDFITKEKFDSLKGGKIKPGDLLFCLRGSLGKCAIVTNDDMGTVASSLAIVRIRSSLSPEFLLIYLQSSFCANQILKFDNGTAQPNLSAKNLLKFEVPILSTDDQALVIRRVNELMTLCDALEANLNLRTEIEFTFANASSQLLTV